MGNRTQVVQTMWRRPHMPRPLRIRRLIRRVKHRIVVVGEILRHPQTPWYVRVVAITVIAYAASPIDLIPDFIPVLGYLDDLILLPLGIILVVRLTPLAIRQDAVRKALHAEHGPKSPYRWFAAGMILAVWLAVIALIVRRILT
jgi:uncharacterized membrane protein YkvA (DUF1232 family)